MGVEFRDLLDGIKREYTIFPFKNIDKQNTIIVIDEYGNELEEELKLPLTFINVGFVVKHPDLSIRSGIANSITNTVKVRKGDGKDYNEAQIDMDKSARYFCLHVIKDVVNIDWNGKPMKYEVDHMMEIFRGYNQAFNMLSNYYLNDLTKVTKEDQNKKKDSLSSSKSGQKGGSTSTSTPVEE